MRSEKILIVDDDPAIRRLIWKSLQSTGILIYQSDSVEKTLDIMTRIDFDLYLLDIGLEYENDGYQLAQLIREQYPTTPIIFLSGKKSENDIVAGLATGADYYMTKPFSPVVLKAQVLNTLDRMDQIRSQKVGRKETVIKLGCFRFEKNTYQFFKNDQLINLSSKETQLILFFMENPNQVFSKEQIYTNVWGDNNVDANLIMVYINYLRNKIEDDPKKPQHMKTVWGIGYTFVPDAPVAD